MNLNRLGLLLGPTVALCAHSEVYMTEDQAVQVLFPSHSGPRAKLKKKAFSLSKEEAKKIEKLSGETVRSHALTLWKSDQNNVVYIDQVLGKHEMITYAIGIDEKDQVVGVEIIEYRESYGHQIRRPEWRKQFIGKNKDSELKLDKDITNISGATLSSAHITAGVKRILKTHDEIKKRI
ncbi:MAG: FMN-binding protein [Bdellovibrionales bacterium]|nr:FMN-binding protein [Bdellovibrionales bacterium]